MEARCLQQPSTSSIPVMAVGDDVACCSSDMQSRLYSSNPRRSAESTGKSSPAVLESQHIYFGSNSDVSAEEHRVSLSMSAGLKLGRFDRVYLDTCDIPGMESSRINNSTDSPASSSTALTPVVPDWRLHRRLDVHMTNDQPGLKSGEGSHPLNNYDDSDVVLENGRDTGGNLGRWDLSRWEANESRHDKKTLKFKDPMVQGSKRIGSMFTDTVGGVQGRTRENDGRVRVYAELQHAKITLVETLEAVIALLSVDVDENCECSTAPSKGAQPMLASEISSPDIGYTSTISSPHSEEHIAIQLEGTFRQSQSPELEFPIPCEMRSTYNEPAICPMEITEESRLTDKSPIPQSEDSLRPLGRAAEARLRKSRENNSHSRVTSSYFHRGKSSQKSLAREPSSASVSDWDVREAEIEVKQPQTFSESDEAFEEFVRNQERQFPPPSPPELWDPLQAPASWREYNQSNAPRQWTAPVLLEDDSYSGDFPATHEMGVQVNSVELESAPKKPFLGRLFRTSSELGERWRAVVKSRGMKSWIWKKKSNAPGAPAPFSTLRDRSRDNYSRSSEGQSPAQSETAATMVSVVSQDCGWPTSQLRKLIPRRFTDDQSKTSMSRPSTGDTGRLTTYGDFFYVESGTSLGGGSRTGQTFTELSREPGGRGRWKHRRANLKSSASVLRSVSEVRHRHGLLVEMPHSSLDSREKAPKSRAWDEGCSSMNPVQFREGEGSCGAESPNQRSHGGRWRGGLGKEQQVRHEQHEHSTRGGEEKECMTSLTPSVEEGLEISSGSESIGKTGSSKTQSNKECGQSYRRRSSSIMSRFCSCVKWQNGLFGVSGSMSGTTFSTSEQ